MRRRFLKLLVFFSLLVLSTTCRKTPQDEAAPAGHSLLTPQSPGTALTRSAPSSAPRLPKNLPHHVQKLVAACEQGSPSSCRVVHTLFAQGRTVQQNTPLSLYFRKRAQVYYAAALTRWDRQCKEGRAEACMNVGMTLRDGLGGERDASRAVAALHKAATLFKEGCTLRRVGADCYRAARVYTKGFSGVKPLAGERGFRKAKRALLLKMYRLGCELRSGEACHAYGELARTGKYMKKDLSLAKELYQKACSLLAPGILRKLSCTYAKGERPTLTRTPTK